jgi:hypothetical protein
MAVKEGAAHEIQRLKHGNYQSEVRNEAIVKALRTRIDMLEAALENATICKNAGTGLCGSCIAMARKLLLISENTARRRRVADNGE